MNEDDFSRLPPAAQAYIRELETRNRQLGERVAQLEEQFRLAQSKRFAPSSEKLGDRVFDEAEQIAATDDDDAGDVEDTVELPDTGLPDVPGSARNRPGRKPLPAHLPRQRVEYDLPEEQKVCPSFAHALHRMGEEVSEQLQARMKHAQRFLERAARLRGCSMPALLILLMLTVFVVPATVTPDSKIGQILQDVLLSLIVPSGALAVSDRRLEFVPLALVAVVVIAVRWEGWFFPPGLPPPIRSEALLFALALLIAFI
ncbi:transposase domain-containing protein, partial [Paraburkholderia sp. RL17-373-BIF-A]